MFVKHVEFENYRNLKNSVFDPGKGINVICGDNAQGKTNLIECLWLFTGGRSFRGSKEKELIAFGETNAVIKTEFFSEGREQTIEINIEKGKRKATLNGVPRNYLSEIVGKFCAVVFSPDHLTLIKNGPDERRAFIDGAICQTDAMYALLLSRYKKILNERNNLIRYIPQDRSLMETLSVWNETLAAAGSKIAARRAEYVRKLNLPAISFYDGISKGRERLQIEYRMNCKADQNGDEKEIYNKTLEKLINKQNEEISCGYTTSGIHRDDLMIKINDKDARSFGSQGQQRSAVLSLKLAEAAVLGEEKKEAPIILLDDVLSELDVSRQSYLLTKLSGMQVFITCCEKTVSSENVVYVENGILSEDKEV